MNDFLSICPIPFSDADECIQLAHGGGGRKMQDLLRNLILPAFENPFLRTQHDGAVLGAGNSSIAFTTDSFVVRPLFFPGGDIGTLAINGTVNDLAMCGARPRWLSAGLILEEGFPVGTLRRVLDSMREAAHRAGVQLVTGDTKVVDRGKCDGLFINTAGIGTITHPVSIGPGRVEPGDALLINGDLGRHGIAVMSAREGLEFEPPLTSDCAPVWEPVQALLDAGLEVHCLRDLTRGGLVSALNEIASASGVEIRLEENTIPVCQAVRSACELLGLDPLSVANEGRFVAVLPEHQIPEALSVLHAHRHGKNAVRIGRACSASPGQARVTLRSPLGTTRLLDMLSGEQLPRIC